jgi:hypothetical protein
MLLLFLIFGYVLKIYVFKLSKRCKTEKMKRAQIIQQESVMEPWILTYLHKAVGSNRKQTKIHLYNEGYLKMGFTWCGNECSPMPECLVCEEKLPNISMVPNNLGSYISSRV